MDLSEKIRERKIGVHALIIDALKLMDAKSVKLLFVFNHEKFISILTIGDIQRAIIKGTNLSLPISIIMDINKKFAKPSQRIEDIKSQMFSLRAECMPVVDNEGNLVEVYFWKELFGKDEQTYCAKLNLPVVIMAGGKGTRLAPLTNVYPKPLIPVGQKTIVEEIMDRFVRYGCHDFYMSVNYKAEAIENYFDFIHNPEYRICYLQEDKPMGTAGSLRLLKDKIDNTFFVSNCDILIEEDFATILDYHRKNHNELTVVAAVKTFSIPYGTIQTGEDGLLQSIEEKPTFSFKINTGLYILEPSLLEEIPDDFFHITHLMEKLKAQRRRVGVYPISQNDWKDMGDWGEYLKMINVR